jgi:glycerophosphoryl diester phosphodiesterase
VSGLQWLTDRPIAHRGLHGNGIVENSLAAVEAAATAGYGIEVDLQLSRDGEVVVFHDSELDRLTAETGKLSAKTFAELTAIPLKGSSETIPSLADLLRVSAGRTPLVLELKSRWDGDMRLVERVAAQLKDYAGPVVAMSFDPDMVVALRKVAPGLPRGIVAERWYKHPSWNFLSNDRKHRLGMLMHLLQTKPHFIAYAQFDLPAAAPLLARSLLGMKLLTWTVRTEKERTKARRWAQQIIFEFIRP